MQQTRKSVDENMDTFVVSNSVHKDPNMPQTTINFVPKTDKPITDLKCSICQSRNSSTFYRINSPNESTKRWLKSWCSNIDIINFEEDIYLCSKHLQRNNELMRTNDGDVSIQSNQTSSREVNVRKKLETSSLKYSKRVIKPRKPRLFFLGKINESCLSTDNAKVALNTAKRSLKRQEVRLRELEKVKRKLEKQYRKLEMLLKYHNLEDKKGKIYLEG